jgi:hypothetical protein
LLSCVCECSLGLNLMLSFRGRWSSGRINTLKVVSLDTTKGILPRATLHDMICIVSELRCAPLRFFNSGQFTPIRLHAYTDAKPKSVSLGEMVGLGRS